MKVVGHVGMYAAMYKGLHSAAKIGKLSEHALHGDWGIRMNHHVGHHMIHL